MPPYDAEGPVTPLYRGLGFGWVLARRDQCPEPETLNPMF